MTKKMQKYIAFQGNFSCTIQKKIIKKLAYLKKKLYLCSRFQHKKPW